MDKAVSCTAPFYPPEPAGERHIGSIANGVRLRPRGCLSQPLQHRDRPSSPRASPILVVDADIFAYPSWSEQANQQLVDGLRDDRGVGAGGSSWPAGSLERDAEGPIINMPRAGEDPTFRQASRLAEGRWSRPFAAFDLVRSAGRSIPASPSAALRVTADGEVVTEQNRTIPGAFIMRAGGLCPRRWRRTAMGYASGLSLGEASFFRSPGRAFTAAMHEPRSALTTIRRRRPRLNPSLCPCPGGEGGVKRLAMIRHRATATKQDASAPVGLTLRLFALTWGAGFIFTPGILFPRG